jgi:hypothetical protein
MSGRRRYDVSAARPARESLLGFQLVGFAINDTEPKPEPWWGRIEITQGMPLAVKAYWERWNSALAVFEDGFRKRAIEALQLAGMPGAHLNAPLSSELEAVIRDITNGYRLELKQLGERSTADVLKRDTPFDDEGRFSRELCARVIVAAGRALGSPGHETTAKYLNGGLPSGKKGLTRDHVGRANKSHDRMLERLIRATWRSSLATPEMLAQLMFADRVTAHALDIVYRQARARPEFKMLRGEDLAWAVHTRFDLNERIHRAACWVRGDNPAAVAA